MNPPHLLLTSTGIVLVLLIAQLVRPSFAQQDILEQTTPEGGLCLGDVVMYSCMVQASHSLLWRYTENGSTLSYSFVFNDSVTSKHVLGPLELELRSAEATSEFAGKMISTATFASGLTAAEEGAVISCAGNNNSPERTIFFAVPSITKVSFCTNTLSWDPPPCDANCTVSVDGQEHIGPVPCRDGNLPVGFDLSSKTVNITAHDQLGQSVVIQAVPAIEPCPEKSEMTATKTSTTIPTSDASPDTSATIAVIIVVYVFLVILQIVLLVVIVVLIASYFQKIKEKQRLSGATVYHKRRAQEIKVTAESKNKKQNQARWEISEENSRDVLSLPTESPRLTFMSSSSSVSSPEDAIPAIELESKENMTNKTKWEIAEDNSSNALPLQTKSPPLVSSSSGTLSPEDAVPAIELGINDSYTLLTLLKDVSCQWEHIGLALHLRQPQLDAVKVDNVGKDLDQHLSAMLQKWLNCDNGIEKFGTPSWRMLVEALEGVKNCKPTANRIKEKKPWRR